MYENIDIFEARIKKILFKLNKTKVINATDNPSIIHFYYCYPTIW
jgi:hypothetical protein